jgi:alkanesulfonate monooxygenase SsuD/methylene tetrahydromethanopterin reductase-like flavin-dependent oxidoreductase (luciferase family)
MSNVSLSMLPTRKPRPPMWLGGSVEAAVRRVAHIAEPQQGDTWVASSHLRTSVIIQQANAFTSELAKLGKPKPVDFPVLRNIIAAPDRRTAIRDMGPAIADSYKIFGNWGLFTEIVGDAKPHPEFEDLLHDRFIIGSPEECAEQIAALMSSTGCNRLITRIQWVGAEQKHVMRSIELLGSRVAPLVAKALGTKPA